MNMAGKAVLITGASQGLGRALAVWMGGKGARLVLAARNEARLVETERLVREAGGTECHVCGFDLCDRGSLERLRDFVQARLGVVGVLVNNAADVLSKPLLESGDEEIERLVRTNVTGPLQLVRYMIPLMQAQGGLIINVSSLAGYKPNPAQTVYSVTKGAVNVMSHALRAELEGMGIRVMNVGLSSVAATGPARPGQLTVAQFLARMEQAVLREEQEVFFSPVTHLLMRVYGMCPRLMRGR